MTLTGAAAPVAGATWPFVLRPVDGHLHLRRRGISEEGSPVGR